MAAPGVVMLGLILAGVALVASVTCLILASVALRRARSAQRMVDPVGWDAAERRMHDVELQRSGRVLHFSTCWCRGRDLPQPKRRSPMETSRWGA